MSIEKLKSYRQKIEDAKTWDKELGELIGIELFDRLYEDSILESVVDSRVRYLHDLVSDTDFARTQDDLFTAISEVIKLITPAQLKEAQARWNNAFSVPYRGVKQFWTTLPELHKVLSKKDSFYRMGDKGMSFSFFEGDILHAPVTFTVRKQYMMFETFLAAMQNSKAFMAVTEAEPYNKFLAEYTKAIHQFNGKIYATPKKLHVAEFVEFYFLCMKVYPRAGFEFWHRVDRDSLYTQHSSHINLKSVKHACLTVIDDLLELLLDVRSDETSLLFTLSAKGLLSRTVGSSAQTYSMETGKLPHRLVKELDKGPRSNYHNTDDLAEALEVSAAKVRKCIDEIRNQVKKNFKPLDGKDFIEVGKKGSGYRLSSNVRIVTFS